MRKAAVVFSAAAVTVMTAVSIPTPVEARGGWGWGPGIAGGLIAGALIGGLIIVDIARRTIVRTMVRVSTGGGAAGRTNLRSIAHPYGSGTS